MDILFLLAKYTYLTVGILFLPVMFYFTYKIIYDTRKGTSGEKKKQKDVIIKTENEILKPLNCKSCGGIIATSQHSSECKHCGSAEDLPEHYNALMKARLNYERVMEKALKFQKQFEFLNNPVYDKLFLILVLWIVSSLFLVAFAPGTVREFVFSFIHDRLLLVFLPSAFTLISLLTVAMLLLFRVNFDKKTVAGIPLRKFDEVVIAREETKNCGGCGAPVYFEKHQVGHVCQYCGVECYRVNFAYKVSKQSGEISESANVSLINSMIDVEKSVDNFVIIGGLISGASVLVLTGVFLYHSPSIIESIFDGSGAMLFAALIFLTGMGWLIYKLTSSKKNDNERK